CHRVLSRLQRACAAGAGRCHLLHPRHGDGRQLVRSVAPLVARRQALSNAVAAAVCWWQRAEAGCRCPTDNRACGAIVVPTCPAAVALAVGGEGGVRGLRVVGESPPPHPTPLPPGEGADRARGVCIALSQPYARRSLSQLAPLRSLSPLGERVGVRGLRVV